MKIYVHNVIFFKVFQTRFYHIHLLYPYRSFKQSKID